MNSDYVRVTVGCPTTDTAESLATVLITAHLCASAHITPITTIYRWNHTVHHHTEHTLTLTTLRASLPAIIPIINALHPYTLPAIIIADIEPGSPEIADWIKETAHPGTPTHATKPSPTSD